MSSSSNISNIPTRTDCPTDSAAIHWIGRQARPARSVPASTPLYPSGTDLAGTHFETFAGGHTAKLEHVLLQNPGRSPFLSQPEVIMIFDLLEFDEFQLLQRWNESFPASELEQLAILWGKPLP